MFVLEFKENTNTVTMQAENQKEGKIFSQKEKYASSFVKMKVNITENDRKEAMEKTGVTQATIVAYLKGDVRNLDLAANLHSIFMSCIERRETQLQTA